MMKSPVSLDAGSNSRRMHLTLADLDLLFRAPVPDPFNGSHLAISGLETILQCLKRSRLARRGNLHLTIAVPARQLTDETPPMVRTVLADHIDALIRTAEDDLALLRRQVSQSLKVGGLFLASCLLLAAIVDRVTFLPEFLQTLLRESLVIAGWVGLWNPLDLLLYAWWPSRYRIGRLEYVQRATVEVVGDADPA